MLGRVTARSLAIYTCLRASDDPDQRWKGLDAKPHVRPTAHGPGSREQGMETRYHRYIHRPIVARRIHSELLFREGAMTMPDHLK